jgi:hypothetical protein
VRRSQEHSKIILSRGEKREKRQIEEYGREKSENEKSEKYDDYTFL